MQLTDYDQKLLVGTALPILFLSDVLALLSGRFLGFRPETQTRGPYVTLNPKLSPKPLIS